MFGCTARRSASYPRCPRPAESFGGDVLRQTDTRHTASRSRVHVSLFWLLGSCSRSKLITPTVPGRRTRWTRRSPRRPRRSEFSTFTGGMDETRGTRRARRMEFSYSQCGRTEHDGATRPDGRPARTARAVYGPDRAARPADAADAKGYELVALRGPRTPNPEPRTANREPNLNPNQAARTQKREHGHGSTPPASII